MAAPFWLGLFGPKASRLLRIFGKGRARSRHGSLYRHAQFGVPVIHMWGLTRDITNCLQRGGPGLGDFRCYVLPFAQTELQLTGDGAVGPAAFYATPLIAPHVATRLSLTILVAPLCKSVIGLATPERPAPCSTHHDRTNQNANPGKTVRSSSAHWRRDRSADPFPRV